jgi:hypothetical protein
MYRRLDDSSQPLSLECSKTGLGKENSPVLADVYTGTSILTHLNPPNG